MHDKEQQKEAILKILKETSQAEIKYTKDQNFLRAIDFALSEVQELEQEFHRFVDRVDHLEVFQDAVKEPLMKDMEKMIQNLKYLIEKNYTKEDKEKVPIEVLNQVRATQDKRINLLKKIARRYFYKANKD